MLKGILTFEGARRSVYFEILSEFVEHAPEYRYEDVEGIDRQLVG